MLPMCVRLALVHVIITPLCSYVFLFRVLLLLRALRHFGLTFIDTCLALLAAIKRVRSSRMREEDGREDEKREKNRIELRRGKERRERARRSIVF